MPQLNPAPWFTIFVFSWMVFLMVIPPKVLSHTFNNEPTTISVKYINAGSWNWPWQ